MTDLIKNGSLGQIMVVDDYENNLKLLVEILSEANFTVREATDGETALKAIQHKKPDLIILDIKMPGLNGYEVCRILKEKPETSSIPIIFITAFNDNETKIEGFKLGGVDFIQKPFISEEVVERAKTHLSIYKLQQDLLQKNQDLINEINMRKQAQHDLFSEKEQLKESEEKFRHIFENSLEGISLTHLNGKLDVNNAFCEMLGYTQAELQTKNWKEITHPDDIVKSEKNVQLLIKGLEKSICFEKRYLHKNGDIVWAKVNTTLQKDQNGNNLHFITSISNITDLKKLVETIKPFQLGIESSSDAIFITDKNGIIQYVNSAFENTYGYSATETIGQTPRILKSGLQKAEDYAIFWQTLLSKNPFSGEIKNKTHNGRILTIQTVNNPILNHEGEITGYISINRNITNDRVVAQNLLEIQQLTESFINANTDMMFVKDHNFRYLMANNSMASFFNKSKDELINKSDIELAENANVFPCQSSDERALISNIPFKIIEHLGEQIFETTKFKLPLANHQNGIGGIIRDVTEREQYREWLIRSEEKYRHLFDQNPQALWIYDPETLFFLEVNEAATLRYGYSREEFKLMKLTDIHAHEDIKTLTENFKNNSSYNYSGVWKQLNKNNQVIYVDIISHSIKLASIKANLVLSFDITKRRCAELELQKILQAVIQSPASIVITNTDGIIEYVNPKFEEITGYLKAEAIGQNPNILKTGHTSQENYQAMWAQLKSGKEWKGEFLNKKKNGNTFWELATISPVKNNEGIISNFIAIKEDITKRKRNDQVQKILIEISNAAITSTSLGVFLDTVKLQLGTIIDTTNFYVALYNDNDNTISIPFFQDTKDSISYFPAGKTLTSHIIQTKKPLLAKRAELDELIRQGKIEPLGEKAQVWLGVPLLLKNKTLGVFAVQSYENENAYTHDDLRILQLISHQISISIERKMAHEELQNAYERATESDRLKSAFMTTMSHELRTPLNAVIGFSEIINENLPVESIVKFSQIINKSGIHLLEIIDDIFDITIIESGNSKIEISRTSLIHLRNEILPLVHAEQKQLMKEQLLVQIDWPHSVETFIDTDARRLIQILMNLLKNALKFTDSGFVRFGYTIENTSSSQNIIFYVKDSGQGIAPEKQNEIFNVFRQADESLTRKHGGIGIGLSIAKKLTNRLGGKIWLESQLGKGSQFYVSFTLAPS